MAKFRAKTNLCYKTKKVCIVPVFVGLHIC